MVNPYQNVLKLIDQMGATAANTAQSARQLERLAVDEQLGQQRRYIDNQRDLERLKYSQDVQNDSYRDRLAMRGELQSSDLGEGDALSLLRGFEGFRDTSYYDVTAERIGYGSDTITSADGSVRRVRKGDRVSREDAERDLSRRAGEFAASARKKIGEDAWDALPGGAKAALTSVTYNYGSIPNRIVGAARSGDLNALANAVEGLGGDNNGINRRRRAKEASYIRGSARSGASAAPGTPAQPSGELNIDPVMSSQLARLNLKPLQLVRLQTGQYNSLPKELKSRYIPYVTSADKDRYGNVPYILVEPIEAQLPTEPNKVEGEEGKEAEAKPETSGKKDTGKPDISALLEEARK
jgi:GH24 family phage-related lysozyme (muramidase)